MKMSPMKNICSLCNRSDVKFYNLMDSIKPPNHLYLEGHTNLQAVLEKILNKKGNDEKTINEICQKCREKLHGIYSFTHQHNESEKIFHQITDVTVRLKKLKSFSILTDFKTEFEAIAETDKDINSREYSSAVCDNLAVVKMECHVNYEDRIDFNKVTKDLNIGLLGGKCSNSADGRSVEQKKIDSMDSEAVEQTTIQDEIIKEEWTTQEGDIFESNANNDVLDREQTKLSYKMCDKPSHAGVKFNCDQYDAKCETSRGLRDHKMSHTGVTFTCNQCDKSFSNKPNLRHHLRIVHTDVVFSCDHCDDTYNSKQALNMHKRIINGKFFDCDQCDARLKSWQSLIGHKMSHTGPTFACNKCNGSFSSQSNLTKHQRGAHGDVVFSCDHCDATYKSKQGLSNHKRIIGGTFLNCDQCDARFKSHGGLSYHKMSHTGVTFSCNKCDASFSNKGNLARHLREVHTDLVFSCDHCDVTYKSKRSLNVHKRIINKRDHEMSHTGVTFACNKCAKSFSNKEVLSRHLRKVHTDVVFSCDERA